VAVIQYASIVGRRQEIRADFQPNGLKSASLANRDGVQPCPSCTAQACFEGERLSRVAFFPAVDFLKHRRFDRRAAFNLQSIKQQLLGIFRHGRLVVGTGFAEFLTDGRF
jgi:hypothetical protein